MVRSTKSMRASRGLRVLLQLSLAILLTSSAAANPRIKCGRPTKSGGFVDIAINLKRGGGTDQEVHQIKLEGISFGPGTSADDKAEFIEQLIIQLLDKNGDYIAPTHAAGSPNVEINPQHGWEMVNVSIAQDGTGEPDYLAYDGASGGEEALCSLSGTAAGIAPGGGPGVVAIQAFGVLAQVQTSPGMPAQFVEQLLMQQFQGQGIQVRLATATDFNGRFTGLTHDANVFHLDAPAAAAPLPGWMRHGSASPQATLTAPDLISESVADNGLTLDLIALTGKPDPTVGAGTAPGAGLALEVNPSVFGRQPVEVRFAAGELAGEARLTVYDCSGRTVRELPLPGNLRSGAILWNGRDGRGLPLPSGAYLLRLQTSRGAIVRKAIHVE